MEEFVLQFDVQQLEDDFEGVFLTRGGTLGDATARAQTDFALTHSDASTHALLTDKTTRLTLPLSPKLVETSKQEFAAETGQAAGLTDPQGRPVLLLSERTHLLLTSSRMTAAINGTTCSAIAGQAATPLSTLFSTVPASAVTDAHPARPTTAKVPFRSIGLRYANWPSVTATVTCANAQILRRDPETRAETPVSVAFFVPQAKTERMAAAEPCLKTVYDQAWASTETVVGTIPNLTKSVLSCPHGINGSGYALSAMANDIGAPAPPEVLEAVMWSAIRLNDDGDNAERLLADLSVPSHEAARTHGLRLTTALSAAAAFAMPYKVDGAARVLPTGLALTEAENWKAEPDRVFGATADDCEGLARFCNSVLTSAQGLVNKERGGGGGGMDKFPTMRALANFQTHYVTGLAVLAANAGNADAADTGATHLAGHCILAALPKIEVARARAASLRASSIGTGEKAVAAFEPQKAAAVAEATFEALYPKTLTATFPDAEQKRFGSFADAEAHHLALPAEARDQPFLIEGTAFASARAYTHSDANRLERLNATDMVKRVSERFEPNIAREYKTLDVAEGGQHAFYKEIVEVGFSPTSPLFTDSKLRSLGAACTNFRFAKPADDAGVIAHAGVSPQELSTSAFALVPMFALGEHEAAALSEATDEALANTMPRRAGPMRLSAAQARNATAALASLRGLEEHFAKPRTVSGDRCATSYIISFASLIDNPAAIESFCENLKKDATITGDVWGAGDEESLSGIAVGPTGDEFGRFVTVEVECAV